MNFRTSLELGRVSNLPTVWSNVLVGIALVGGAPWFTVFGAMLAMSLMYLSGMFLNDVCDAKWDAQHGQQRPIVRGAAGLVEVTVYSVLLAAMALVLVVIIADAEQKLPAALATLLLAAAIAAYDFIHKRWAHSAWIMGSCRFLVYLSAASLVASPSTLLILAGLALLAYIAGITYLARAEHLNQLTRFWPLLLLCSPLVVSVWVLIAFENVSGLAGAVLTVTVAWLVFGVRYLLPGSRRNIPKAIGTLLAGLCLIDATLLAAAGEVSLVFVALAAFALCLLLQTFIKAS